MKLALSELALIAGMFAVTFGVRYATLALVARKPLPVLLERALHYVPVAVLTAIIVPAAMMPAGELWLAHNNAHLWAGAAATGVAWRWRALLPTIVVGMAVFFLVRWWV